MTRPAPTSPEAAVPRTAQIPCPCCGAPRSADHPMCHGCWATVPKGLAAAVEAARRAFGRAAGSGRRDPARLRATAHDLDLAQDAAVEAARHALGRTLH